MAGLRAVLLDMDGTLVDSEPLAHRAWTAMLATHGFTPTEDDLAWTVGRTFPESRDRYARRVAESGLGELPGVEDLYAEYWPLLKRAFAEDLRPFDDAVELVDALRDRMVPVAIASNSVRERVAVSLGAVGRGWDSIPSVAGDEVDRPKPAPDVFVAAAARLGVQAYQCVVVEDSAAGEEAARIAGATCLRADRVRAAGGSLAAEVLALLS